MKFTFSASLLFLLLTFACPQGAQAQSAADACIDGFETGVDYLVGKYTPSQVDCRKEKGADYTIRDVRLTFEGPATFVQGTFYKDKIPGGELSCYVTVYELGSQNVSYQVIVPTLTRPDSRTRFCPLNVA